MPNLKTVSEDLSELYQAIILEHSRRPHNARVIEPCTHSAEGLNPLCGDEVKVYVLVQDGRIADLAFKGQGCAISQASASLMTERLKGKLLSEVFGEARLIEALLTGEQEASSIAELGDLVALEGVRQFPARIKCATLAWHTLEAALRGKDLVSIED